MKRKKMWKRIVSCVVMVAMLITMLPADLQVTAAKTKKMDASVKSPVNATNGAITFNYVGTGQEKMIVKGSFNGWGDVAMTEVDTENHTYSVTVDPVTGPGIYTYGMEDKAATSGAWKADPLNPVKDLNDWSNPAFVRNPIVDENTGVATIYYQGEGQDVKVYYKKTSSGTSLTIGEKVTEQEASALGYKVAAMSKNERFAAEMYSADIAENAGAYEYVLVDKDNKVLGDPFNFVNDSEVKTFELPNVDKEIANLKSPVCASNGAVTFNYYNEKATAVYVAGSFTDWQNGKATMKKDDAGKGIWSYTTKLAPGNYEYKLIVGESNWITDPLAKVASNGNSIFTVEGLALKASLQVERGNSVTLPTQASLYAEDSSEPTQATVQYSLKVATEAGVTLENGVLSADASVASDTIVLLMTDGTHTSEVSVEVVDKMYTYTIHYYSDDQTEYANRDLWIWEANGKAYNTGYEFNKNSAEADAAGRVWATAEYKYPTKSINMIVRTKGTWGVYQEDTRNISIPEGKENAEVWILKDSPLVYNQWAEKFQEAEKRYILVEYDREDSDYADWNIYTWNSGSALSKEKQIFFDLVGEKRIGSIVIGEKTESIGFLIRKGLTWEKDVDGDRAIQSPLDQKVIKVKAKAGEASLTPVAYNKGYERDVNNKKITFLYRDDELFRLGTLTSLQKVQVEVDGTKYDMTYDAENERYQYVLNNPSEKVYEYSYFVTDKDGTTTEVLDLFNANKNEAGTKSTVEYKDLVATVTGIVAPSAIDYNQNAVLTVTAASVSKVEAKECYVDLSSLGGKSKVKVDVALMEVSIAVADTITAGKKQIPITLVDQYDKKHTGTATVEVKTRVKTDSNDFDWDESVIYFMVTDRFNDGNQSNNDIYGVGDYDLNGPSSYHGGDFAGVTQKLDYLKDLGINTIWITPVVENILEDQHDDATDIATYGYHGYWASSFEKLNQHLGTVEEFHTLIDEAHSRGIKIMVDVVLNHAGYAKESVLQERFPDMFRDEDVEGHDILGSLAGLPDFATEKEEVRTKLVEWQTKWVSEIAKTAKGNSIDYFRVDTVKHVESTTWAQFKNALTKIAPAFKMIGEYAGAGYVDDFGYLNTGLMDSLLDFGFNNMADSFVKGSLDKVETQLEERNAVINNTGTLGSFLGSHDEDGFKYTLMNPENAEEVGMDVASASALSKVAASLQMTAKGQPVIYYGEEIGLTGANDWPYQTNRYDMKFDNLTEDEAATLAHYKKVIGIRNDYTKVFAKGTRTKLAGGDAEKYIVFGRKYQKQNIIVGLNITNDVQQTKIKVDSSLKGKTIKDVYSGTTYNVASDATVTVSIPAAKDGGTAVFAYKDDLATGTVSGSKATITAGLDKTEVVNKTATIAANVTEDALTNILGDVASGKKIDAVISVSNTEIQNQLKSSAVSTVNVKIAIDKAVSASTKLSSIKVVATKEALKAAKTAKKTLCYTVTDETGKVIFKWEFAKADLAIASAATKDINLMVSTDAAKNNATSKAILAKDTANSKGVLVKFKETGVLPLNTTVTLYVGEKEGLKAEKKVYIYRLNTKTGKLVCMPTSSAKLSKDGYVTLSVTEGGTYVLLPNVPTSKVKVSLANQITTKFSKTKVKKGKTATVSVTLPSTLKKITSFSDANMKKLQTEQVGVIVSYKSSKTSVAKVSSTGKITAKKVGKTKITVTYKLSDGTKKTVTKTVSVTKK